MDAQRTPRRRVPNTRLCRLPGSGWCGGVLERLPHGLEGIVCKRRDAPYRSGRVESWIKLKCVKGDTFPIIAFVEKLGAKPRKIASLYLGKRESGRLLYAGKARTGYTEAVARERLDPLIRKNTPLDVPVKKTEGDLDRAPCQRRNRIQRAKGIPPRSD
jgi:ATP-dependent DNA ligase